jgi:16S rRNA (adenine1518-N6/adenine1519-N6)-dimethyltransferase
MLRQSLKSFAVAQQLDLADLLEAASLDPTRRAEEIDVAGFVKLARAAENLGAPVGAVDDRAGSSWSTCRE